MDNSELQDFIENMDDNMAQFFEESEVPIELLEDERYRDFEFLAKGGIKEIYKAYDSHCDRWVAFAKLRQNFTSRKRVVNFIRELQLASTLEHPNIVRVYDIGVAGGQPFFTMELISGKSLKDWCEANPSASIFKRLELFLNLCEAVSYAHNKDILHLDITPLNITIRDNGSVLLMDWGISLVLNDEMRSATQPYENPEEIKGTPGFMAPEQLDPKAIKSSATDTFALGAILYYILSGEEPIKGDSLPAIINATRKIHLLAHKSIPTPLYQITKRAMDPIPTSRFDSVADLHNEVETYLNGFATFAERSSIIAQARLFFSRNKFVCITVFICVLFITITTQSHIRQIKKQQSATEKARKKAQDTLDALEDERILRAQGDKKIAAYTIPKIEKLIHKYKLKEAYLLAQKCFYQDPSNEKIRFWLGALYLLQWQFDEAKISLDFEGAGAKDLVQLLDKNSQYKAKKLSDKAFSIYRDIIPYRRRLKTLWVYSCRNYLDTEQYLEFILQILEEKKGEKFSYHYSHGVLDLSMNESLKISSFNFHAGDKKLAQFNMLSPLKLKVLKLPQQNNLRKSIFEWGKRNKVDVQINE